MNQNQNPEVNADENADIICEYYSAECEVDEDTGKLIPEYGEVSASDIKEMEGYDLPVHRSLWK